MTHEEYRAQNAPRANETPKGETTYTKLIERLRATQSRSKRALLDEAADAIEKLSKGL